MSRRAVPRHGAALASLFLFATLALLALPTSGYAEFAAPTLLSGTQTQQFEEAGSPAFAQEGRYVAFRGSLAGVPGVYRRDLQTGEIAIVAGEDATAPSISANGRYIAFTSAAVLDPQDEGPDGDDGGGCPQVYVRDMDLAPTAPDAYTLASVPIGSSEEGLTFAPACPSGGSGLAGAQAAGGVALSANGREVAFTVLSSSDLMSGEREHPTTEASQVAVRDLETHTTTLVSATPEGLATPGGGAYPSAVSKLEVRFLGAQPAASSAAISADGSTVAWEGTNVPEQVPSATEITGGAGYEVEPLWRRIADGPTAVTKRLLAGAGLEFFAFGITNLGEGNPPVRAGALALEPQEQDEFIPPALSADGRTVVTIANAFTPANQESYRFVGATLAPPAEAYLVRVGDEATSMPEITPLTATPDFALSKALLGGIGEVAISPDGSRVAFNTRRVNFALAPPILISPPVQETSYAYTYVANLSGGTLQRVTRGYEGSAPNGEPGLLSFAGDDLSLAFASAASNLFFGDGTPGASQVYLTQEVPPGTEIPIESVSPAPALPLPPPAWVLSATATVEPDGSVLIDAQVPGAGKLQARASAQLPATYGPAGRRTERSSRTRARASGVGGSRVELLTRTVSQAATVATVASELRLRLRPGPAYRALVASRDGLYVLLRVTFTAPGHSPLVRGIPVTLRLIASSKAARAKGAGKSRSPRAASRAASAPETRGVAR
jgi:hypothetical protein